MPQKDISDFVVDVIKQEKIDLRNSINDVTSKKEKKSRNKVDNLFDPANDLEVYKFKTEEGPKTASPILEGRVSNGKEIHVNRFSNIYSPVKEDQG